MSVNGVPERKNVNPDHTWDLTKLFDDKKHWVSELERLKESLPSIQDLEQSLLTSPENFSKGMELYLGFAEQLSKLYSWVSLASDQDLADSENLGMKSQALDLYTSFSKSTAWLRPAILELELKSLENLKAHPDNEPYLRMVREIVRFKPHTLGESEEKLMASSADLTRVTSEVFSQLNNADLSFESVEVDGEEKPLTHGSFITFLKNPNREVRRQAYQNFYSAIEGNKNTLASLLAASVKKNVVMAEIRKYNSPLESALFSDNIPSTVYQNLIESVSSNLKPLNDYYSYRKEVLSLDKLEMFDSYYPIIEEPGDKIPYDQACQLILESVKPLGQEYCSVLERGLTSDRWVDRYENKGKRSGAYAKPCYGDQQYMLMNYKESQLNDLFTLTHEAGHAMHSWYSQKHQNFQDFGYTIFVAEVASTFNEQLLLKFLKDKFSNDSKRKSYLINHHLEDIKGTFYRQTMFAEFEMLIHKDCQNGKPLTRDSLTGIYKELLSKYFGPAMNLTEGSELECFRIPHFYSPFYVYQYATGLASAIALSKPIIEGDVVARDSYLNFLSSGCSKYSVDLLKDAGVDITKAEPLDATAELFADLLAQLKSLTPH